ncbi:MAG: aspartate kinase [Deltaproteobacteria bacterium]|nr:aspartate kinase [Deltaproteobacteria bacterium]
MAIVVQKYGGSSVADVDRIRKVADKVVGAVRAGNQVVVVVSAMGKTTDGLLTLAQEAGTLDGKVHPPPRRELDMLVTTGERVSMALLSIAIHARGHDAISFTGSQCGIITNDRHFNARIIEVRPHRVEDELERGKVVIIAGYQGMSYKREITTLGRGGSDTTAVAMAAALQADRCEIYSDVDGVYSADPRVVPEAVHIRQLDHELLQEMAECGAKVLNAQAVEWARRAGIAIYARSSFGPADANGEPERQTIVRKFAPTEDGRVRAVVGETQACLVRLEPSPSAERRRAWELLRDADIPLRELSICERGTSFVVPMANVPDWGRARALFETEPALRGATILDNVAVVSVVGAGLTDTTEPLARMFDALGSAGIEPIEVRASPLRLRVIIAAKQAAEAQRLLHEKFVAC